MFVFAFLLFPIYSPQLTEDGLASQNQCLKLEEISVVEETGLLLRNSLGS